MEETVTKYIMRRKNGPFVDLRFNPVSAFTRAARFWEIEDFDRYMNGYYKPKDPENYEVVPMEVTYRVVETNVQEV